MDIGTITLEDYLDIKARKLGFEYYEDLVSSGFSLEYEVSKDD